MKLVCLSDTHGRHRKVDVPDGDVLIHSGDISNGSEAEVEDFLEWFAGWSHPRKIFIAGNMDYAVAHKAEKLFRDLPADTYYLEDEMLEVEGMKFWGSPYVPNFVGVFNLPRGQALREVWARIPDDIDFLITHGPPFGILDRTSRGMQVGCEELRKRLDKIFPKLHLFGHVHESYGQQRVGNTLFVNASLPGGGFGRFNRPLVLDLE